MEHESLIGERQKCPGCGNYLDRQDPDETVCTPITCGAWRIVGKATPPNPLTGARRMLRLAESKR